MSKDKKLIAKTENDYLPPLLKNGYFSVLTANRAVNYRKELVDFLNAFFPVSPLAYNTWKNRYNNPELIPNANRENIIKIMEEGLVWALKRMRDDMTKERSELDAILEQINNGINIYHNE
jgi:hypothetical protein